MQQAQPKTIPDKLYFKIGEVCELIGVEPHVLRYWEQEFPQLTPQKNSAGQRVYRRRDVEVAMRIKALREEEGFTIAGAKKKLAAELRSGHKLKVVPLERPAEPAVPAPAPVQAVEPTFAPIAIMPAAPTAEPATAAPPRGELAPDAQEKLRMIRAELEALLTMLR